MKKPVTQTPPRRSKSADSTPTVDASIITTTAVSPHRRSLSAIPFSWEQHPGIAKPTIQTKAGASVNFTPKSVLPRPPPMSLSHTPTGPVKKRNSTSIMIDDPFELALTECVKAPPTPPGIMEEIWGHRMVEPQRTRWQFGFGINGRCNAALSCSTVDSMVHVPRARVHTASFRILSDGRLM